jgi:hypothetical protein
MKPPSVYAAGRAKSGFAAERALRGRGGADQEVRYRDDHVPTLQEGRSAKAYSKLKILPRSPTNLPRSPGPQPRRVQT